MNKFSEWINLKKDLGTKVYRPNPGDKLDDAVEKAKQMSQSGGSVELVFNGKRYLFRGGEYVGLAG